jgi:NOL1/NOP2/fmu family ribosome biogenesis protein
MFVQYVLEYLNKEESFNSVLDLCASPGGKSLCIQNALGESSVIVSNEIIPSRNLVLRDNIMRWGLGNTIVTASEASAFKSSKVQFDLVLVDAPCSGEGMFRKDEVARKEWSPALVQMCCSRQSGILDDIRHSVKPGGYLIYSTCTFASSENEEQLAPFLSSGQWESVEIPISSDWGIQSIQLDNGVAYRFIPGSTIAGEGLFLSVLRNTDIGSTASPEKKRKRKKESLFKECKGSLPWGLNSAETLEFKERLFLMNAAMRDLAERLSPAVKVVEPGIQVGQFKGKSFIPHHALALQRRQSLDLPSLELSQEQALQFLRKDEISDLPKMDKSWILLRYRGEALGWIKSLGNRLNNYYPKALRILSRSAAN